MTLAEVSTRIIQPNEFNRIYVEESDNAIAVLLAGNVQDGELKTESPIFLSSNAIDSDAFLDSYLNVGDILITRTGANAGATCAIRNLPRPFIISSHSIRIVPNQTIVDFEYFEHFLLSRWGKAQVNRLFTGAAQRQLQLASISQVSICVPSLNVQRKLVAEMQAARESRKQKLAQADALLNVDDFLLNMLGLSRPKSDSRQVFGIRFQALRATKRLNSEYYHPERMNALRIIQTSSRYARLADFVHFIRKGIKPSADMFYIGLGNVQSNTGEFVETGEEVEGQVMRFQENDVLFGRLRPYLNKVIRADRDGVCSGEFHILRANSETEIGRELYPDYLAAILRSALVLIQTKHMMTGNTHPRLTNEDVVNLVVPIPPRELQKQIATEISQRQQMARHLRTQADAEWQTAKKRFEEQLLGE